MKLKVFGCKTNGYFARRWIEETDLGRESWILVASCVVTDQAKRRWTKFALRSAKELETGERLYLTGCGSLRNGEIDPDFYNQYPELAPYKNQISLLPEEPPKLKKEMIPGRLFAKATRENLPVIDNPQVLPNLKSKLASIRGALEVAELTRKTVVVQTGCDNFCTFCLTVQARGRHAYRPAEDIVREIRAYVASGGHEVVLTGINLGAWGAPSSNDYSLGRLGELIDTILTQTAIERLRISSLGVEFLSDEMIQRFAHPRVVAYAHLSIQSGSDMILRRMGRHYSRDQTLDRLTKLSNLLCSDGVRVRIWADLIVGFPWETEDDYMDTHSLVTKYGISQLHAFPFSAHVSSYHVPAGGFSGQILESIKLDRLARLISAGDTANREFIESHQGRELTLLVEGRTTATTFRGWSQNYIELTQTNFVPSTASKVLRNELVPGILTLRSDSSLKSPESSIP